MRWHGKQHRRSSGRRKRAHTKNKNHFVSHKIKNNLQFSIVVALSSQMCSEFELCCRPLFTLNHPKALAWNNQFHIPIIQYVCALFSCYLNSSCFPTHFSSLFFIFCSPPQLIAALSFILSAFSTTAQSLWPSLEDNKCGGDTGGKLKYLSGDALTDSLNCIGPNHLPYPHAMINRAFSNSGSSSSSRRGRQSSQFTQPTLDPVLMQSTLLNAYKEVNGDEPSSSSARQGKVKLQYLLFLDVIHTAFADGAVPLDAAQKKKDRRKKTNHFPTPIPTGVRFERVWVGCARIIVKLDIHTHEFFHRPYPRTTKNSYRSFEIALASSSGAMGWKIVSLSFIVISSFSSLLSSTEWTADDTVDSENSKLAAKVRERKRKVCQN